MKTENKIYLFSPPNKDVIYLEDFIGRKSHKILISNGNMNLTYFFCKTRQKKIIKTIFTATNGSTVLYQGELLTEAIKAYNTEINNHKNEKL